MILILLDRGRFAVVHPCSTFLDRRQVATPQNAKVHKTAKFGGFHSQRTTDYKPIETKFGIKIEHGFALAHLIWPLSVNGARYRSPPNVKICPKLRFFVPER